VPRILIAECKQEVSTFNPAPSHYEDFDITRGEELLRYHRAVRNEAGGALSVFDARAGVEVIPTYSARAITSGGILAAADFRRLADEMLACLREAPPADAAYFSLHGAMAAEGEDDPEGYLLAEARKVLGERMPIVASYDLHGILTERMLQHADACVVYHTYPHTDFYETGQRSARLLLRILAGEVKPVTAKVFVPALVRGDELITASGLIRFPVQAAMEFENSPGGLSAGLFWGNPFTDVAGLGTNSMVTTDGDPDRAAREALRIARLFWQHHEAMQVPLTSLHDAAQIAADALGAGTTVLVDAADATSSGAPGDSNAILRALLARGYRGKALIPIVDPAAARAAFEAGVGRVIRVKVGGAIDSRRHQPLEVEARVRTLSDGQITSESYGEQWFAGDTAVLHAGAVTLIVTSRAVSLYDRSLFYAHGCDPRRFDAVVVKSPHCQPHMFKDWAARYVNVDAPGATSANLRSLGHTRCARPMFPLDPGVTFTPQVKLFSRS
jgi:microcystin degradation protein MlrC